MQAHLIDICIGQQAHLPLPLLKNYCESIKKESGIVHYLSYILAIKAPTMVRTELYSDLFKHCKYFCLNTLLTPHLPFLHFIQFGLLFGQCASCLLELVDDGIAHSLNVV